MRRRALVIGVENYVDDDMPTVDFAEADANDMAAALQLHGFDVETILTGKATKALLEHAIEIFFENAVSGDELVLFYAGHGIPCDGYTYLCGTDTVKANVLRTGIVLQNLLGLMKESPSDQIILYLDCCHSGLDPEEGMRSTEISPIESELDSLSDLKYRVAFAACGATEVSRSHSSLSHGIWSYHLIRALRGEDTLALNGENMITAMSLQNYLSTAVKRSHRNLIKGKKSQNPCLFGNLEGDFPIADMNPIFKAKQAKAMSPVDIKRLYLSGLEWGRIRSLTGFKR